MAITRPRTEQIKFNSTTTGEHILDDYLNDAERGGKTLAELLDELLTVDGQPKIVEYDLDNQTYKISGMDDFKPLGQFEASIAAIASLVYQGKIKVSATDTTANTLEQKLQAGANITITKNNSGSNETLTFSGPTPVATYSYDNRGNLRSITATDGTLALVEGLGLFRMAVGSTEPDDDESCFATADGRWLLEAPHWDVVDTWQLPDDDVRDSDDEDEPLRTAAAIAAVIAQKFLTATFTNNTTSVSANSRTTITVAVPGASPGDAVFLTRSGAVSSNADGTAFPVVTSPDTVTVYLCGHSDTTAYFQAGTWRVTVIKDA